MPLDLSEVEGSPIDDDNDLIVTLPATKPAEQLWKENRRRNSGSGIHPIVVVPSDSEDDSDDDIAIVSVCPPPPSDSDDCIVESYQPASESLRAVDADRVLTVPPASDDDPAVDVSCPDSGLDLQFTTYNPSTSQTGAFLVHDVPNLGAWLLSSEPATSVKQPDLNYVPSTCSMDSPPVLADLAGSSSFGVPLSMPSDNKAHPQPAFSNESVQFNTVKLQTGGILFDVGAAKVSTNIDKTSVLSLSAKIQSDDRHSTTLSFVGSILDHKNPAGLDFVSAHETVKRPPDDLNLSLIAVSPAASPDVVSSDKVNSYCQTASVSLNVNANVDAALNDTVDGLLMQMSHQKPRATNADIVPNVTDIKQNYTTNGVCTVDIKDVAQHSIQSVAPQSSDRSQPVSHLPTSVSLWKKRKMHQCGIGSDAKSPRLLMPQAYPDTTTNIVTAAVEQPYPILQGCCCCENTSDAENLSHCVVGHPCCGICLQKHVKSILTSNVKV